MDIVFDTIEEMVEAKQPEAVTAFNTIYGHLEVVEYCAPLGIHVMVEKPLAVNLDHAEKMIDLAKKHNIQLLTNYETSWYGSTEKAYEIINEEWFGGIRRIGFHTGHPGPIEIGVNEEFLEWLTDPVLNGGGALTDFGCYGANIATWIMKGEPPQSVSCKTQQIKPDLYPIYGKGGHVICRNAQDMELLDRDGAGFYDLQADPLPWGIHDPFAYLNKVIKEDHPVGVYALSSMENNRIVMQILEAARISAETGEVIIWDEFYN
jgi:hypothetical protein